MEKHEFVPLVAYLNEAAGKEMTETQVAIYWDLLGDLPAEVLLFAVKRAVLELTYPVLPPVGVLRRLALDALNGADREPTADEAWELVRRAINAFGYMREQEAIEALPAGPVRRAVECLGWQSLCGEGIEAVNRAQYRKAYETLAQRRERQRLLPAPMIKMLERIGRMPELPELQGYDPRNAWQLVQDTARQRRLPAPQPSEGRKSA
jgi:hypothetical protein